MSGAATHAERPFHSPASAAELLGISPAHVRRLISSGELVAANLGSGRRPLYVIPHSELVALLRARGLDRLPDGAVATLHATSARAVASGAAREEED